MAESLGGPASFTAVAAIVDNKTIVNMPLLDRRSSQLQRLNGFVVANGTGGNATFAIAGGRGNNANYLIDGGNTQNLLLGVPTLSFDPPVESVQEFNLSISYYEAELGRTGGAVVQMTTKSGTNTFHGSAYEFFRNDALNARTFFATTNPRLRYNLFGVSASGPIIRNKTLFFFNYEGRRQITSLTVVQTCPPMPRKRVISRRQKRRSRMQREIRFRVTEYRSRSWIASAQNSRLFIRHRTCRVHSQAKRTLSPTIRQIRS